jgi:hypothetical protein
MTDAEIEAEDERFFATIGKYVIFFQEVEGKVDQILLLAWGLENWTANQAKLARLSNKEKIDAVQDVVLTSPIYARARERPEWLAFFTTVVQCLQAARELRNSMLHSYYEFKFTEIGSPVLRLDRRGNAQYMSTDVQHSILADLAQLAVDLARVHIQLIALTP